MPGRAVWAAAGLAITLSGCAQYGRALMEFDSATGFDAVATEPRSLEFREAVRRWPWLIRQLEGSGLDRAIAGVFAVEPFRMPVDNPSAFVRDRVELLASFGGDDLHRTAQISRRLMWLVAHDSQTLDQIVTLDAIEKLIADLGVDPLDTPFSAPDRSEAIARRSDWMATVERLGPARRDGATLDGDAARDYLDALSGLGERPSGVPSTDRMTILMLDRASKAEDDQRLREPTRVALVAAIRNGLCDTLRRSILSATPMVRQSALLSMYRLSGPRVVPFALYALTITSGRSGVRAYDPDEDFRRTLLQLCAGLPEERLYETYGNGPPPIEFVYDTAVRDESEGLRRVAMDAFARCVDEPIVFERDWIDQWWRERALAVGDEGDGDDDSGAER